MAYPSLNFLLAYSSFVLLPTHDVRQFLQLPTHDSCATSLASEHCSSVPITPRLLLVPSPLLVPGLGTWAWGNKVVWGYEDSMDTELQEAFNLCVTEGINWFDTADSYG